MRPHNKEKHKAVLVADSGGSKIDWKLVNAEGSKKSITTPGFNPCNQPASDLKQIIAKYLSPHLDNNIKKIFFYGAGLDSDHFKDSIRSTLQVFLPQADIKASSDLLGAAKALCGDTPGIVCILGTGSNCAWYDGTNIDCKTRSLGWILGDEGSGSYLGKRLIGDYLQDKTPASITHAFRKQYPWSKDKFLQHIYEGKQQAAFLGSFSPFVAAHIQDTYCHQLVCSGFEFFCKKNIMAHKNYDSKKVHFTGSIAYYYADLLRHVAKKMNITITTIIKAPIDKLTYYHQQNISATP